ncbi:MAG: hypothetical protein WAN50_00155 [Minisyncoccia bacterium]
MAQRKTNVQIVKQLMERAESGPLMQAFIVTAITKYAELCANEPASTFDSALLSGEAWKRCAVEAKKTLEAHYGL